MSAEVSEAIVDENEQARLIALRTSLSLMAFFAIVSLFFVGRLPTKQPTEAESLAASTV